MICEKCQTNMNWFCEGSSQGWLCSSCGWGLVTTYFSEIYCDMKEYSIYINNMNEVNYEKIKFIARTAGVNYVAAKQMLMESRVCILKDKAPKVKEVIKELEKLEIQFEIIPELNY